MENRLTLQQARRTIVQHVSAAAIETVPLLEALGRISARAYYASYALPDYRQSLFDGYAIAPQPIYPDRTIWKYTLAGEVAAGDTPEKRIGSGVCYRIMTGAMVPRGTWKIIPQEKCEERAGVVSVEASVANGLKKTIRGKGTRLRKGSVLASRGCCLTAPYLARLAQFGIDSIEVYRRLRVACFCTGSELINSPAGKQQGKKFSSNRYLLSGLIRQSGGEVIDGGTVSDEKRELESQLLRLKAEEPEIIISTGGMGPGKYDLLEECFLRVGGKTIFTSIQMRPGKSVLFGLLGRSLYFGLPGPPFAVQTLFYALVLPTISAASGCLPWKPKMKRAALVGDLFLNGKDMLRLQEGLLSVRKEVNTVRLTAQNEIPNCYIYCHAGRKTFRRGALVSVQLIP
jgi:molybdopterin molybdotransferase